MFLIMNIDISHHIKGIRPALQVMAELGYRVESCLTGTGISLEQLDSIEQGISKEQEFAFYRRLLELSGDAAIGLRLGTAFRLESYGVFGYAILSAPTLRDGLMIASKYGALSFSHFDISLKELGDKAYFQMARSDDLPEDLLAVYEDRDCSAIASGAVSAIGQAIDMYEIHLMHSATEHEKQNYEAFFPCPVKFGCERMELIFDAKVLDLKMPLRDPTTADYCRQQCEILLRKAQNQFSLADRVRESLRESMPNCYSTRLMAEHLNLSERSLRRKLAQENVSFKTLLTEERKRLALGLMKSEKSLDQIAAALAYSEAANFSHAFKRWYGLSPTTYKGRFKK